MFGLIKDIIIGLHKRNFQPCGFGFVIFHTREAAEEASQNLNRTIVDTRRIKIDFDIGFSEGRQYGRGYTGGQVIDEFNQNHRSQSRGRDNRRSRY